MAQISQKELPKALFRVDLRRLILWLCLFFVFLALGNSLHAAYKVQRDLLLQHSSDTNRAYAEKLAQAANSFLRASAQALQAAALDITESRLNPAAIQTEFSQLASVTDAFNEVIVVDRSGKVIAAKPDSGFLNTRLAEPQARHLLDSQETTAISSPFKGPSGRWMSLIAHPIFWPDGSYAGFLGGAVNLRSDSALQSTLESLHYQEGSYFYIVDETSTIVYHPAQSLIGSLSKDIKSVPAGLHSEPAMQHTRRIESDEQLVSYASIPFANWNVVAQRSTHLALSHIDESFLRTFYFSLPLFIISLAAIWWLSRFIANPLRELAEVAANLDNRTSFLRIRFIKGWYVEAAMIREGLMQGFSAIGSRMHKLHLEGTTDALTGAVNRRGLEAAIEDLNKAAQSVAVVMVDVDHFKAVNDTYGHAIGDEVLKAIASLTMAEARTQDVVARMGGEEFVVLLPEATPEPARRFAERLRSLIEHTHFDDVGQVTISVGVACYPAQCNDLHDALQLADAALYRAKAMGRNRVHLA